MPVFPATKIVYIHIPKTAGTSVEEALALREGFKQGRWPPKPHQVTLHAKYLYGPNPHKTYSYQHLTWREIQETSSHDLSDFICFATLRDPWARIVSEVKFQMTHSALFPHVPSFKEMARASFDTYKTVLNTLVRAKLSSLKTNPHLDDNHWLPQAEFLKTSKGEIDPVIHLVRFSHLQADLNHIMASPFILKHSQRSKAIHPRHSNAELFEEDVKELVKKIYAEDFALLASLESSK